jgi:hypothetical protein
MEKKLEGVDKRRTRTWEAFFPQIPWRLMNVAYPDGHNGHMIKSKLFA